MEEILLVQKRPAAGNNAEEFYYRIVNSRTRERLIQSYRGQGEAESTCQWLNTTELLIKGRVIESTYRSHFFRHPLWLVIHP